MDHCCLFAGGQQPVARFWKTGRSQGTQTNLYQRFHHLYISLSIVRTVTFGWVFSDCPGSPGLGRSHVVCQFTSYFDQGFSASTTRSGPWHASYNDLFRMDSRAVPGWLAYSKLWLEGGILYQYSCWPARLWNQRGLY